MANICMYKVLVKGRRNACMAFFGSTPCLDDKWITSEEGTDEHCTLLFEGDCKWEVDAYCKLWCGECPVELPEDAEEALRFAEEHDWYYTVQSRSEMFNVEVFCNSLDECSDEPKFEHYINGMPVYDSCPQELEFDWDDPEED